MDCNAGTAAVSKLNDRGFLENVSKRLCKSASYAELEQDVMSELEAMGDSLEDVLVPLKALIGRAAWEAFRIGHTEGTANAFVRPQTVVQPV